MSPSAERRRISNPYLYAPSHIAIEISQPMKGMKRKIASSASITSVTSAAPRTGYRMIAGMRCQNGSGGAVAARGAALIVRCLRDAAPACR